MQELIKKAAEIVVDALESEAVASIDFVNYAEALATLSAAYTDADTVVMTGAEYDDLCDALEEAVDAHALLDAFGVPVENEDGELLDLVDRITHDVMQPFDRAEFETAPAPVAVDETAN